MRYRKIDLQNEIVKFEREDREYAIVTLLMFLGGVGVTIIAIMLILTMFSHIQLPDYPK